MTALDAGVNLDALASDMVALIPDSRDRAFIRAQLNRVEVRLISEREDTGIETHAGWSYSRRIAAVSRLRKAIPQ